MSFIHYIVMIIIVSTEKKNNNNNCERISFIYTFVLFHSHGWHEWDT